MMRRLAAAVLAAAMNLVGSMDLDAAAIDDAADDTFDGSLDVEWRTVVSPGDVSAGTPTGGTPLDGAWTARGVHGQAAAVGVKQRARHVTAIGLTVTAGCPAWPNLMTRALAFCRDQGSLKLLVESNGVSARSVRALTETHGFQFTRSERVDGVDVSEFYVDLYRRATPQRIDGDA